MDSQVKGPKGDKAGRDVSREVEERAVSLVSSLLQVRLVHLRVLCVCRRQGFVRVRRHAVPTLTAYVTLSYTPQSHQHVTKAGLRDRVAAKFVEAEFEKTDMLVEIMFK